MDPQSAHKLTYPVRWRPAGTWTSVRHKWGLGPHSSREWRGRRQPAAETAVACSGGSSVLIAVSPPSHMTILLFIYSSCCGRILGCLSSVGISWTVLPWVCLHICLEGRWLHFSWSGGAGSQGRHTVSFGRKRHTVSQEFVPILALPVRAFTPQLMMGIAFPLCICHSKLSENIMHNLNYWYFSNTTSNVCS